MYTTHFNLNRKPFQISSDAGFIWLGEKHKEGLATLRYGILDNKGFLVLTGDVGTGKTTLINALIGSLSSDVICASVPDPSLDKLDFFNYIAAAFDISGEFASKGKFLAAFASFLRKTHADNKKALLIIDEAQLMTQELLEEIRLLSNIVTTDSSPLLNIFFVGQYEFNELITRKENRAIAQRITLNYYIEPLSVKETREYIRHRLKIAGTTLEIFNSSAIKDIYEFSHGFPRKINIICDHCLMSGFAEDKRIITAEIVKDSAKELQLPGGSRQLNQHPPAATHEAAVEISADLQQPPTSPREQSVPGNPVIPEAKESLARKKSGLLLILVFLISFCTIFFYYTNERFMAITDHFFSIQEKIARKIFAPLKKIVQPEAQNTINLGDGKTELDDILRSNLPPVANVAAPVDNPREIIKETPPVPAADREENNQIEKTTERAEEHVAPVVSETVTVQPVVADGSGLMEEILKEKTELSKPQLPQKVIIVRFKSNSNLFSVDDIEKMKEFSRNVKEFPDVIVTITGYSDSIGNDEYNRKLSEFRANMVKSFLMGQNFPPERMKAQGLGQINPIGDNNTKEGRILNRRVEITVDKEN